MQRIPVIATLLETPKETIDDSEISETTSENAPTKEISLFDWISPSEKDSKSTLDDVYELCKANLKKVINYCYLCFYLFLINPCSLR